MGGYVAQTYARLFPGKLHGFVSVDSAPLQREYVTSAVGFAVYSPETDSDVETVFKRADTAMYGDKVAMKAQRRE